MNYPKNIEEKIGFDAVRGHIASYCVSEMTKAVVNGDMVYNTDHDTVTRKLGEVEEMMNLIRETSDGLPLSEFADMREPFAEARAVGTFMDIPYIDALRKNLLTLQRVVIYLKSLDEERFPRLRREAQERETFQETVKRIDSVIDKFLQVRDSASPRLGEIRRSIQSEQSQVVRTLNAILREAKARNVIDQDVSPTMREGRLMLPVPSANKRQVQGIVHDESATGKTSFIEPAAVVEINNHLRELQSEERREIIKILTELTEEIRPLFDAILEALELLTRVDSVHARAKYALKIEAVVPQITKNSVEIFQARHPLLEQSLKAQGKEIVPLEIKLTRKQRIIIISGPNAGGKSVCLKTLGLLQYMIGCGLPIPVAERSSTMLFDKIMVDIGDEQSIENDLSTYSSHLLNMKNFMRHSDGRTLLLIDEFGTGTEPLIGGAIAEAVLGRLNEKGVYGVITTHYSNLKTFAANTQGLVNGAMLYDRHNMQPLFTLSIGMAGSSFAIDIATKIGLPREVIDKAKSLVGEEQVDFDKYLQDVARDKRYWAQKREQIKEQERRLKQMTEQYETRIAGVKAEERQILADARTAAADLITNANAEIEKTIRVIKESEAERKATREARNTLKEKGEGLMEKNRASSMMEKKVTYKFKIGDAVQIEGQQVPGKIVDMQGRQAVVVFGQIKTTLNVERLKPSTAKPQVQLKQQSNIVDVIHTKQNSFSQEIDLRGMRVDEALNEVVAFIDDASMLHIGQVRILHGTGTGALRQAIREYLATCYCVKSFRDEHVQFGGAGITVVTLDC